MFGQPVMFVLVSSFFFIACIGLLLVSPTCYSPIVEETVLLTFLLSSPSLFRLFLGMPIPAFAVLPVLLATTAPSGTFCGRNILLAFFLNVRLSSTTLIAHILATMSFSIPLFWRQFSVFYL